MQRPNILLILCDELRADALGCFGSQIVQTPYIDRLAREGTLFEQCMVTQPTCTPSRASILSGCYPSALRSRMVGCYTPADARFLPYVLAGHGYRTASIGKLHLVPQRAEPNIVTEQPANEGHYFGFQNINLVNGHGDRCFGPAYTPWLMERVPDLEKRLSKRKALSPGLDTYTWPLPPEVHSSYYIADQVEDFLDTVNNEANQPFFLQVSFPDPHYPFVVPEPYASMYAPEAMPPPILPITESQDMPTLHHAVYFRRDTNLPQPDGRPVDRIIGTPPHDYSQISVADWQQVKATYYGMVSLVDDRIGRILTTLDKRGLRENTIIVFLSDHGDYLGDHGFYGKGLPYDSVLRTPLIMAGPEIMAGQRIKAMATTLDIAPTIANLSTVPTPEGMQGRSMKPALQGDETKCREAVLTENDDDFVPIRMRTITTTRWKLTYYHQQETGELIDREHDADEMVNLYRHPDYTEIKQMLMNKLLDLTLGSIDTVNGRRQSPTPEVPNWT